MVLKSRNQDLKKPEEDSDLQLLHILRRWLLALESVSTVHLHRQDFPLPSRKRFLLFLPLITTSLCEAEFSVLTQLILKRKNRSDDIANTWVISFLWSRLGQVCEQMHSSCDLRSYPPFESFHNVDVILLLFLLYWYW